MWLRSSCINVRGSAMKQKESAPSVCLCPRLYLTFSHFISIFYSDFVTCRETHHTPQHHGRSEEQVRISGHSACWTWLKTLFCISMCVFRAQLWQTNKSVITSWILVTYQKVLFNILFIHDRQDTIIIVI